MTAAVMLDAHGAPLRLCGYAAVWDSPSVPMSAADGVPVDGWRERLAGDDFKAGRVNAFARTLVDRRNIDLLVAHERGAGASYPLASTSDGTLKLWTDSIGLAFEASHLQATTTLRGILQNIRSGEVGCSYQGRIAHRHLDHVNRVQTVRRIDDLT